METGKISESVLKRSVLKQIKKRREEVILGAAVGEDCTALDIPADELVVMSVDPITGAEKDIGKLAVNVTVNDLASAGAEPVGLMLSILLPVGFEEQELKEMMASIDAECEKLGVEIMGGHTEITGVVTQPVITVAGVGRAHKNRLIATQNVQPGNDIVATKWIALEGTSIIAKEKREELLKKFAPSFVDAAASFSDYISVYKDSRIALANGVTAMHDVTEGGIFGALWEMAEGSMVGLDIDLKSIPIRQESVEICNFYDINPYLLISSGCMLMAAENGYDLVRALKQQGIEAAVIGKATDGNDRIIRNGEEVRYLEPPKPDELYKVV